MIKRARQHGVCRWLAIGCDIFREAGFARLMHARVTRPSSARQLSYRGQAHGRAASGLNPGWLVVGLIVNVVQQLSDEQLAAEAAREGSDGPAFVELVERFRSRVWHICFRLLSNEHDANDAAQEVFVRLYYTPRQIRRTIEIQHLGSRHRGSYLFDHSARAWTPATARKC